jgi:hypothetical protein
VSRWECEVAFGGTRSACAFFRSLLLGTEMVAFTHDCGGCAGGWQRNLWRVAVG